MCFPSCTAAVPALISHTWGGQRCPEGINGLLWPWGASLGPPPTLSTYRVGPGVQFSSDLRLSSLSELRSGNVCSWTLYVIPESLTGLVLTLDVPWTSLVITGLFLTLPWVPSLCCGCSWSWLPPPLLCPLLLGMLGLVGTGLALLALLLCLVFGSLSWKEQQAFGTPWQTLMQKMPS